MSNRPRQVHLPSDAVGTVYFVDEAGSKGTLGQYFVTAAVRTPDPDRLLRRVQAVRDKYNFTLKDELKFSDVTRKSLPILAEVMETAVEVGCTFGVFVLDKRHFDPWKERGQWEGHLFATRRLLKGMLTRREVAVALLDHISVPENVSYGQTLVSELNGQLGNKRLLSAVSLDSRTCSGLQVADLLASAVFHERTKIEEHGLSAYLQQGGTKPQLARRIAGALGVGTFDDCKTNVLTVQTSHERSLRELRAME